MFDFEQRLLHGKGAFNPIALRKTKIAYNFGLSECNRVKKLIKKAISGDPDEMMRVPSESPLNAKVIYRHKLF